jgi:DNA-binding transcriptional ArsR family regulator
MSDSAFKALADPTRREILRLLAAGDLPAGVLGERFDISQPAVSRHLAVLRAAGLVTARRDGQNVMYALDTTVVQDVVRLLLDLAETRKPKRGTK